MQRFVYFFGEGKADAGDELRHLVGGKGASLADMTKAQLDVPPGFTIATECCDLFYKNDRRWPAQLESEVRANLARLEQVSGRSFGRGGDPLLVAVRSGAAVSMPGMMDTVLNVGLNPDCVCAMAQRTGNARGAWDAYRHFLAMFGHTVAGINDAVYAVILSEVLRESGKSREEDLDAQGMMRLCDRFGEAYQRHTGAPMPTEPWELLTHAINAVFGSWMNERALTYRAHHKIDGLFGTAVTVQMMCPSEVSGIMFTANPVNPALEQIIIESSYGLGEAIVLGKVTPDRFVLDKKSLTVCERHIGTKDKVIATLAASGAAQGGARDSASLSDTQVTDLARLGLRVEHYFKTPSDIEWALSAGRFYLLQARAIKGAASGGKPPDPAGSLRLPLAGDVLERIRQEEIAAARALAEPGGTVWSRYNLAEILPEPTPMTWAIVRQFMSGQGGFGQMYRDFGFDPDPALDEAGIFDLICGRVYCNLSREPRMQWRGLPFEHPFAALKENPAKALYPRAVFRPARAGWKFWFFLPVVFFRLWRSAARVRRLSRDFADEFRREIVPQFLREVRKESERDLTRLGTPELLDHFQQWTTRTLDVFGRESLKPTLLAGVAMENLEGTLRRRLVALGEAGIKFEQPPPERAQAIMRELVMGIRADGDTDLAEAIRQLAAGKLDRAAFLQYFGHRASNEMELARPRWHEDPAAVDRLIAETAAMPDADRPDPGADFTRAWERLLLDTRLPPLQAAALEKEVRLLHVYLGLREAAKHYLMQGYALIRRILLELDRRFHLDGGIFFLTPEELPRLGTASLGSDGGRPETDDTATEIARRRRRREACLNLPVPQVLFSDDLDALGREVTATSAAELRGVPLSAGIAEGTALVIEEPDVKLVPGEPFILVCPSTDPAWVPLFVHARGLVMETGGMLSHGAIVAREFGLPAVAGLPGIHRRLRTGQRLRIDGATGRVDILA